MKTYTYDDITIATKQIVEDEMARAAIDPDEGGARSKRGFAAGAWILWQTLTVDDAQTDTRRSDNRIFKKLLGLPE